MKGAQRGVVQIIIKIKENDKENLLPQATFIYIFKYELGEIFRHSHYWHLS